MSTRIRYNFNMIRGLLQESGTQRAVLDAAREMDARVNGSGVQSRVDYQDGAMRPRAAVIAGYEDGATAETTRRALLRGLGGAGE